MFEKGEESKGNGNKLEGVNLLKAHYTMYENYHKETLHSINV
jgi:hypothetical protein